MKKLILIFTILSTSTFLLSAQIRIKMQKENDIFTTPCVVNGLRLRFIFDTGASNVSISLSEAIFMLKNGYLQESDLIGSSYSQIANGTIVENTTVNLRELEIGELKLYNIKAVIIHELSAPLLLGQSAIGKLGKIQLEDGELIIMSTNSSSQNSNCEEAIKLVNKANSFYFENLNVLAAETYQKAYDLCPDAVDCWNLYLMGCVLNNSQNFKSAINYLEKSSKCTEDKEVLYYIYSTMANAFDELGDYYNASLNLEKCLLYTKEDKYLTHVYFKTAWIKAKQGNYSDAINNYEKSTIHQLKTLSKTIHDVMRGEVHDQFLGEILWNTKVCYLNMKSLTESDVFAVASALCGYTEAIGYCNRYGIKYNDWEKK